MTEEMQKEYFKVMNALLNGGAENCDRSCEPYVVKRLADPDCPGGPNKCLILTADAECMAVVPPYEGYEMPDIADAIAKSGWVIYDLLAEVEALRAALKEADEEICGLCQRLNQQHEHCSSCNERDARELLIDNESDK